MATPAQFDQMAARAARDNIVDVPSAATLESLKTALWFDKQPGDVKALPLYKLAQEETRKLKLGAALIQNEVVRDALGGGKDMTTALAAASIAIQRAREHDLDTLFKDGIVLHENTMNQGVQDRAFTRSRNRVLYNDFIDEDM